MMFRLLSVFLLLMTGFILPNQSVSGAVYYTSPDATSSGNGTLESPYLFATAISKLVAGDTLWVRGGIYHSSVRFSISKSGMADAMIHILAYHGEQPVFDFRTQSYNSSNQGFSLSGSYVEIKGVVIQAAGDNGLYVTGSNNVIAQCVFRWNCDSGLQLKTGTNNLIKNCDSYENFDYETVNSDGSPNYGGNADGFADKQYTNTSGANTFVGCRSWRNADDGWDHYAKIGNTIDQGCWCFQMAPSEFDMTDHPRYATDAAFLDAFKQPDGRIIVPNYGNGNGFKTGGNYTANNITLTHCLSVNNKVKGFDQNNNNGVMTLYHCSAYANNPNYGFFNSSYGTLIIKNSVSLDGLSSDRFNCKSTTTEYNTWNNGFSCSDHDFVNLDATQMAASRSEDGSLPMVAFMHLIQGSPLIDAGVNVGLPFEGNAPDLGAFEYTTTTPLLQTLSNKSMKAYPNPVIDRLMVEFENDRTEQVHISFLDLTGKMVKRMSFAVVNGMNCLTIDCGDLPRGSYLFQMKGSVLNEMMRMIK
ncbi:MAG: T9SS type A sorting domain-containing protein [Microbacter sp.]